MPWNIAKASKTSPSVKGLVFRKKKKRLQGPQVLGGKP